MVPTKSQKPRKERKFADIFSKYKHHDPDVDGYGNVHSWQTAFEQAMGHDEAVKVVADDSPLVILGFTTTPSFQQLKTKYRQLIVKHHPDHGGDPVKARKIIAAYSLLAEQIPVTK